MVVTCTTTWETKNHVPHGKPIELPDSEKVSWKRERDFSVFLINVSLMVHCCPSQTGETFPMLPLSSFVWFQQENSPQSTHVCLSPISPSSPLKVCTSLRCVILSSQPLSFLNSSVEAFIKLSLQNFQLCFTILKDEDRYMLVRKPQRWKKAKICGIR